MSSGKVSADEKDEFLKTVERRHLWYLWCLRGWGIEVDDRRISELEMKCYPDLQVVWDERVRQLGERDIDELQLLLSNVEPRSSGPNTKALLLRLERTTVRMRKENNHQRAHFHVEHENECTASYAVDTLEKLAGYVPAKYEKRIFDWASRRQESLMVTWERLQAGEDVRGLVLVAEEAADLR